MFTSDWVQNGIAIFIMTIVVLVGIASLIMMVIHYYYKRCWKRMSAMANTPGSSMGSANVQRIRRYVRAEGSVRDSLGWSAAADNGTSADSQN